MENSPIQNSPGSGSTAPEKRELIIESPGRINLIGEHIDYSGGYVMPAAIDKRITLYFQPSNNETSTITSLDYNEEFQADLNKIEPGKKAWENYILGVLNEISILRPGALKNFNLAIKSDLPIGAGISSSAALECGVAKGLNILFDLKLDDLDIIKLSRRAEHTYVGTKCGVMDQFSVVKGVKDHLIQLNCETLEYQLVKAQLHPYSIVLLNTNISHDLASSAYNQRLEECATALEIIKQNFPDTITLVDIAEDKLQSIKDQIPEKPYNRALYATQENSRVIKAAEALENNDLKQFGKLLYGSHDGLQHLYEVSCEELDFLVDFSKDHEKVIGSRMMGGGFGGCTINLIHKDHIDEYIGQAAKAYKDKFNIDLTPIVVSLSDGTRQI